MDFKNLEDIYKYLKPADLQGTRNSSTQREGLLDILSKMILGPRGEIYSNKIIFDKIDEHFKGLDSETSKSYKRETGIQFHAITNTKRLDLADGAYWGKVKNLSDMIDSLGDNFEVAAFVTRSPYLSPATRGTDNVDFFLNYTPPIVAASMMPYLDVEFQTQGASLTSLNTPSSLRFLIGAVEPESSQDKVIRDSDIFKLESGQEAQNFGLSGMEMFLMPQTLTNMNIEGLLPHKGRLVLAKPFLPFASLLGFDVTISNAGAGNFAHKKGTLKFKIHDKARISEIAEFIKGSSGFNKAVIWTTYGWLAPMNRMQEDDYAKFINESMLIRECWSVVNSQFSFDNSGQVSMSLELVSKAAKALESLTVDEVSSEIKDFHEVIKSIAAIKEKVVGENKFAVNIAAEQLLNAASTSGFLNELKDVKSTIASLKSNLQYSNLPKEQVEKLGTQLDSLVDDKKYSYEKIKKSIGTSVTTKFNALGNKPDPFIPTSEPERELYFSDPALKTSIDEFNKNKEKRQAAIEKSKEFNPNLKINKEVVSFGKLFMSFVAPSVAASNSCDELQVFFYGFNDQCGPLSGQSIAEFPVNLPALMYAYAASIKNNGLESLSLQVFLRLVIETQFSDQRAIGYGMNSFFDQIDLDNPSKVQRSDGKSDAGMSRWIGRYGALKMPVIEMFVENGEESDRIKHTVESLKRSATRLNYEENSTKKGGSKKVIKRIHIYDRANNPYRLAQQIIDTGDNSFEIAEVLTGPADAKLRNIINGLDEKHQRALQEKLRSGVAYNKALTDIGVAADEVNSLVTIARPGGQKLVLPKDRKRLKDYLMSTVPCIFVGTNGTLVLSSNASSSTSGLQGAINIMNASKADAKGQGTVSSNPLEEVGGLPLRTVPIQLTMTTMGVPIAQLYQTYFVDFETGTSLDNIYNCTQLQHSISPGKFTTNWTFMYASGYGKFSAAPTVAGLMNQRAKSIVDESIAKLLERPSNGTNVNK
jgi:hypothetical protein